MTPLAQRVVKELTLPIKDRTKDVGDVHRQMDDVHCFEVSDIADIAEEMAGRMLETGVDEKLIFLPAPKTWIEFERIIEGRKFRIGYLVTERDGFVLAQEVVSEAGEWWSGRQFCFELSGLPRLTGRDLFEAILIDFSSEYHEGLSIGRFFRALLAFINTPRIIGRRQHMPHRGLERKLVAARKIIGKFPLHAWTEIKLDVTPPKDASGEPSTEAHLTGQRALHFCRAHLRIRFGRLEVVKAHWRGDASLGIKRSRYRLAA